MHRRPAHAVSGRKPRKPWTYKGIPVSKPSATVVVLPVLIARGTRKLRR